MADPLYIEKHPERPVTQDYRRLKAEGLRHIERLSHELWTDYNVHDPGITILELLCYAITDLGYRTDYPIEDLLTREIDGRPQSVGTFHQALQVLTCKPVTFTDLRKLLIDIEGVRNAWIERHKSVTYCLDVRRKKLAACRSEEEGDIEENPPLSGLYDVYIDLDAEVSEQKNDKHLAVVGLVDEDPGRTEYVTPSTRGILFDVMHELTIEAVHVYAASAGKVVVRLLNEAGDLLNRRTVTVDTPQEKTRIPLGFHVRPGDGYRLDAYGSDVELLRTRDIRYRFVVDNLIRLTSGVYGSLEIIPYYFFYAWEVSYTIPAVPVEEQLARVGRADRLGAPGAYIHPEGKGMAFEVMADVRIETVSVYVDRPGTVRLRIITDEGKEIKRVEEEITAVDTLAPITLDVVLEGGREYRILGADSDVELYRNTETDFPFTAAGVIQLIEGIPGEHRYYFFYDWTLHYTPPELETAGLVKADVYGQVKEVLSAHRNLCEDFVNICALEKEAVAVCADIVIEPGAEVEEVMAQILYQLETFIAPPVPFYTLQELIDKGRSVEEIFEGPVLRHGFIDDQEFREIERREELHTSDLVQIIMDVPGVTAVRDISLLSFIGETLRIQNEWTLELEADRVPAFAPDRSKIIFYKNDLPYYAKWSAVEERLEEKKLQDRPVKLGGLVNNFPVPVGEDRQLEEYYPIQNELPATYMVGHQKVPASETIQRKAQSKQLKAYLLFFEQLLANYLAQLSNAYRLFSWEVDPTRTYFTQVVDNFAGAENIYVDLDRLPDDSLLAALRRLVQDAPEERKNRFLEHLIGRFAEQFTEYARLMLNMDEEAEQRLLEDRRLFLDEYPNVSKNRGAAFDYLKLGDPSNLSGYRKRAYRLLGIRELERRNLAGHLFSVQPADEQWRFELRDDRDRLLLTSIRCGSRPLAEALLDGALLIGGRRENYRFNETEEVYELVRACPESEDDDVVAVTTSREVLDDVIQYFAEYANREGFHVVEHILLRRRTAGDPFLPVQFADPDTCDCAEVREPYSFRMSVILPAWPERFREMKFRAFVEQKLRMEAPAHIYCKICWLNHDQMKQFEQRYNTWLKHLADFGDRLGGCRKEAAGSGANGDISLSGELPLPRISDAAEEEDHPHRQQLQAYRESLHKLIQILHTLDNVHPVARLHDCRQEVDSETPQVTLNNSNLGTF